MRACDWLILSHKLLRPCCILTAKIKRYNTSSCPLLPRRLKPCSDCTIVQNTYLPSGNIEIDPTNYSQTRLSQTHISQYRTSQTANLMFLSPRVQAAIACHSTRKLLIHSRAQRLIQTLRFWGRVVTLNTTVSDCAQSAGRRVCHCTTKRAISVTAQ